MPAARTLLGRWEPFVDLDKDAAFALELVSQKARKHPPSVIKSRLAKMKILVSNRFHVQIFDANHIESLR